MNKEILMIVVLGISVFLLASAVYVYIEDEYVTELPDDEYHYTFGQISDRQGVAYKHVTIEFTNGNNITFDGGGIWDVVMDLNNDTNYTFYWRWSRFESDIQGNLEYVGKSCYQINNGENIIWQCNTPITVELVVGFIVFWIIVGLIFFVGIMYNRKAEERKK